MSDLHLEFEGASYDWIDSSADVVVLAGDIHTKGRGVTWAKETFNRPVIYVLGNHEYWGGNYPGTLLKMKNEAKGSNVHVLENDVITIDGVNFLGCTLWTDFSILGDPRVAGDYCSYNMNDFRRIRRIRDDNGRSCYSKLRTIDAAIIHSESRAWLEKELHDRYEQTNVVVTHHAPSGRSLKRFYDTSIDFPGAFDVDLTNAAYASDLESVMSEYLPNLWIHGHVHKANGYYVANTRVVCNPAGYVHEQIARYEQSKVVDIDVWAKTKS